MWIAFLLLVVAPVAQAQKKGAASKTKTASPAKAPKAKAPVRRAAPVALGKSKKTGMQKGVLQPPKAPAISKKERFALISIEEKVNSLKERIFRSKARLMLLEERVLRGALTTAKVVIRHDNRMSSAFYMTDASYILDGRPIFYRKDYNGSLNKARKFKVFAGTLQPGPHTLDIKLRYRGNGYGVFSYLRGYKFRLDRRVTFRIKAGNSIAITMIAFEKNPLTTKLVQRPTMKFKTKVRRVFSPKTKLK
jgi:hypothetical protein